MMGYRMGRFGVALVLASGMVSCGGAAPLAEGQMPTVDKVDDQQATCKVAKDPLNPLIVEWPGTSKAALDSASQHGIVVVSYVGCALKVLTSCKAGGAGYEFRSVTPVRDRIAMLTESDLYARLPLGAASLKGDLATAGQIDLDYVVVGQREALKPPTMLQGDCRGATHYLRSIMVGAYGLNAMGRAKASAGAHVGDTGIGGGHREEIRRLRGSGDVEQCASLTDSASTPGCSAVLQLGLAPLMVGGGGSVTSAGFGEGLGAVSVVPEVGDLQALPGGGGGIADADVALLRLLQDAKRADKSGAAPSAKAVTWDKLSAYEGKNPYHDLADERREAWKRVAEAEQRRAEQAAKVCAQYKTDNGKLRELLSLDDDVVSKKQKTAYQAELAQVYAPFRGVIDECKAEIEAKAKRAATAMHAEAARAEAARRAAAGDFEDRGSTFYQLSTRLEWQKQPAPNEMKWRDAKTYCASKGWRLPTKDELLSLYNKKAQGGNRFDGMDSGWYWSSSPLAGSSSVAWSVNFSLGNTLTSDVNYSSRVRCVR